MKRATLHLLLAAAAVLAWSAAPAAAQAGEDPTPGNGKKVDHVALLRQAIGEGCWVCRCKLHAGSWTRRSACLRRHRRCTAARPLRSLRTPLAADPNKVVIAQTAPAVRVAIGEMFGMVSLEGLEVCFHILSASSCLALSWAAAAPPRG